MSTAAPQASPGSTRLEGIIDSDVHPSFRNGLRDLEPYLSAEWRHRLGVGGGAEWASRFATAAYSLPLNPLYISPIGAYRSDAATDEMGPATDPVFTARQLLDGHGIHRAILISGSLVGIGAFPDPEVSAVVASAHNDWMCEQWLQVDERFRGALVVPPQHPEAAVREIERHANTPGICAIFMPLHSILMGERHYYPIYEAAQRHALPVVVHPSGTESVFAGAPRMAGIPTYYMEWHAGLGQVHQSNLISMLCHGVFERFPELRLVVSEGGFFWAAEMMWKLDRYWQGMRDDVPWLKLKPSDYVRRNVRFTTQPLPEPPHREQLAAVLDLVQAEETLIYSSDYPHWDFDEPNRALIGIPAALRQKICVDNPAAFYGDRV